MPVDELQMGRRKKKEDHILELVKVAGGKVKVTDLYGAYSQKYQGSSIRTFLNEYLTAIEYRNQIRVVVESNGFWVYTPKRYDQEMKEKKEE